MNNASSTACFLIQGSPSKCVAHSLSLIGTILNSSSYNLDKNALLICTRHSWEESLKLVKGNLLSLFYPKRFQTHSLDSHTHFNNIFTSCLGPQLLEVNSYTNLQIIPNNVNSFKDSTRLSVTHSSPKIPQGSGRNSTKNGTHLESNNFNEELDSVDEYEDALDTMKRLFIRFIDESPSKRVNDQIQELPSGPSLGSYWNFVHSSSEISSHGDSIEYVFVAGLSEITLMSSTPNYQNSNSSSDKLHPFTAVGISEDNRRVYQNKAISMYALALSLCLNAQRSRLNDSPDVQDSTTKASLPKFFLLESLPSDQSDAEKFTKFISERFNFTYLLPSCPT